MRDPPSHAAKRDRKQIRTMNFWARLLLQGCLIVLFAGFVTATRNHPPQIQENHSSSTFPERDTRQSLILTNGGTRRFLLPDNHAWQTFLGGHVEEACFRACWDDWPPLHIDLAYPERFYASDRTTFEMILERASKALCARLASARAFQRCYISHCGGQNARLPAEGPLVDQVSKDRLWAWASQFLARYGSGVSGSQDFVFGEPEHSFWRPFPVGLTAACITTPDEVFAADVKSAQLRQVISLTSADNRIALPQSLRKLLVPIWTAPELRRYWNWTLPQYWNTSDARFAETGGQPAAAEVEFEEPRRLSDLREKVMAVYAFAFASYVHLLAMTSRSRWLHVDILQVLAFGLVPVLPIIQMVHNLIDAAWKLAESEPFEYSYLLAGLLGTVIYDEQTHARSSLLALDAAQLSESHDKARDAAWWAGGVAILVNIVPLLMTVIQYCSRLAYTYHGRAFVATTGFDHRLGWVAVSSFIPIVVTTLLYLRNRVWTVSPTADHGIVKNKWHGRLALQISVAAVVQELLIMLTGRVTVAQVIFDRWLQGQFHIILASVYTAVAALASMYKPLELRYRRPGSRLRAVAHWSFLMASFTYATMVFLLHMFVDMEEYADLALDFVFPWNFRWQLPSPEWTQWWSL